MCAAAAAGGVDKYIKETKTKCFWERNFRGHVLARGKRATNAQAENERRKSVLIWFQIVTQQGYRMDSSSSYRNIPSSSIHLYV